LRERATEEEIKARYKVLAKMWHPDKQRDPAKKLEAQEIFIEIQQAYDTLSKIRKNRAHRNEKSRKHEHTEF
jgi:curved DNA-binding protein CbpA